MSRYLSLISVIVLCFVLLIFPQSGGVFLLVSIWMSAIVARDFFGYVSNPAEIEVCEFFASSLLAAYALSTALTQFNVFFAGGGFAAKLFNIDQFYLSLALISVGITSVVLRVAGMVFPFRLGEVSLNKKQMTDCTLFVIFVFFFALYAFASGLIGFQGAVFVSENSSRISEMGALVAFSLAPTGALAVYIASRENSGRLLKISMLLIAVVFFLLNFTQGRRLTIYAAFVYVIALRMSGWRSKNVMQDIFYILVLLAVCMFGYVFFYAMRLASWMSSSGMSLFDQVYSAFDIIFNPESYGLYEQVSDNALERPFVIGYLSEIVSAASSKSGLNGVAFLSTIAMIIPSVFIGEKNFPIDEYLIHPHFGMPVVDRANSILTTGFSDFGWTGAFVYVLVVIFALRLFLIFVKKRFFGWFYLFSIFAFLYLMLGIEASMISYWIFLRNLAIFALFFIFISFLSRFFSSLKYK